MTDIYIIKEELYRIHEIIDENNIEGAIKLIYNNDSGIGYTLDIEFDYKLNGRFVTVRANITDSSNW